MDFFPGRQAQFSITKSINVIIHMNTLKFREKDAENEFIKIRQSFMVKISLQTE